MWTLLILCISINNPNDIPGKISFKFESQKECVAALNTMSFWLKFDSFTLKGECHEGQKNIKENIRSVR